MIKRKFKSLVSLFITGILISGLIGCGNKNIYTKEGEISGKITSLGSTALQPLVEESAKNFGIKYPKAAVYVQGGGSGAGCNQVISGNVEIGNSDVEVQEKIKDKSFTKDLIDHRVCAVGFAIVTNKNVKVDSLTKEQIQDIFTGKITNWLEVGGINEEINIINRPKSSGTRSAFKKIIMNGKEEKEGLGTIQDSNGNVRVSIKNTKGSISYIALSYLTKEVKKDLKIIKINNIEPNTQNIISGKYSFWAYEHMYTKGKPSGVTKAFLDYMVSVQNEKVIEKLGYIPASKLKNK